MQACDIPGERLAQTRDAEILRIKGFAPFERIDARLADKFRRDFVGLAEPERDHVFLAHTCIGDLADLRGAQRFDAGTSRRQTEIHVGNLSKGRYFGITATLTALGSYTKLVGKYTKERVDDGGRR